MPKLLWVSPLSVHDTASTSATQMRNMLLSLKARNVDIIGLCALNFVHESGTTMFTDLDEKLKGQENSFNLNDNNINFIYIRTKSRNLGDMISQEQRNFYAKFCAIINAFRPDVVMGSGTDMLSMVCFDEARRRGLPTVYTLLDGTPRRFNFPNIDVVVTDSNAISNLYANQHHINAVVTGSFLPVVGNKGKKADKKFITMANPTLSKGLGIFMKIADLCSKNAAFSQYKFSVYEAFEGQFASEVAKLTYRDGNKLADALVKSINVIPHTTPSAEVFAQSKVLICPSLAFEGVLNIAREAIASNVPVLSTNQTGIAESVGEAGILVEPPAYCVNDHAIAPNDEDMGNFLKGMEILINEDFSERCNKVAAMYDVTLSANRLATILKPLFDERASNNPQLLRNGSLI